MKRMLRYFSIVLMLAGVGASNAGETAAAPVSPVAQEVLSQEDMARFRSWLADFRTRAAFGGVSSALLIRAFDDLTPDLDVMRLLRNQPEHSRTTGSYITSIVSDERIRMGRDKLVRHGKLLARIEERYGVPRAVLVAIWGIESQYGVAPGTRPVIRSLATLAAFNIRRTAFWDAQLVAALRIVERGDSPLESMTGSWAGAMGHMQFIPTTFEAFAVDFDGDGKRDIWRSLDDALASAAHYLEKSGWESDREGKVSWGWEVALPARFDYALASRAIQKSSAEWTAAGLRRADGRALPEDGVLSLVVPQSARGPAFLVTKNFRVILRYNNATSYALAVLHLADRLAGAGPISKAWPEVTPLTRTQREALQELLAARGHDTGGIDGILGTLSVKAIRAEQRRIGVPEDGFADLALLQRLQQGVTPVTGVSQ